ncbi:MAG: LytR/AlgR family response regulator transcription factor [Bacteroidales bacterium]
MKNFNICLPVKKGKIEVNLNQILYFESLADTDYMVLTSNEKIELIMNVEEIEQILWSQGFFRISKNYLVNLTLVQIIFPADAPKVVLENGKEIFVPQSRRNELFKALESVCQLEETLY